MATTPEHQVLSPTSAVLEFHEGQPGARKKARRTLFQGLQATIVLLPFWLVPDFDFFK